MNEVNDSDIVIRIVDDSPEELVTRNKRAQFMRQADNYCAFVRDLLDRDEADRKMRNTIGYLMKHGPGRSIL